MIWLIGHKGMLGSKALKYLKDRRLESIQSDIEVDITSLEALKLFVGEKKIEWIINCSAYTAVDRAEDEKNLAYQINAEGVSNIARIASQLNAKLIHISTDYVFDGQKTSPYLENDAPNPIGIYGASKLKGDLYIQNNYDRYFIIRTSWLYGENGNNFVNTMLKLFNERDELNVVDDQRGCPTYTKDLAEFILKIITSDSNEFGVYHFSNEGETTWHQFALQIYRYAQKYKLVDKKVEIRPISTDQYPTKATRPKNTVFSKDKAKSALNHIIRTWEQALEEFISNKVC